MPESARVRPFKKISNALCYAITTAALTPVKTCPNTKDLKITNITDAVAFITIAPTAVNAAVPAAGNTTGANTICLPSMHDITIQNPAPAGYVSTIAGSAPTWGTVIIQGGEGQI